MKKGSSSETLEPQHLRIVTSETEDFIQLCAILSNETRLEILKALSNAPLSIEELARRCNVTPAQISRAVSMLKKGNLVRDSYRQRTGNKSLHSNVSREWINNLLNAAKIPRKSS